MIHIYEFPNMTEAKFTSRENLAFWKLFLTANNIEMHIYSKTGISRISNLHFSPTATNISLRMFVTKIPKKKQRPELKRQVPSDAPRLPPPAPTRCMSFVGGQPAVLRLEPSQPLCLFAPPAHPNNQELWAFLIPRTKSMKAEVELATATIRYSNTAR